MVWTSRSETMSLFSPSQASESAPPNPPANPYRNPPPNHPYGSGRWTYVFYKIQDLDFSNVAYINAILNPCSNPKVNISKPLSVLLVNPTTVTAQRWLLGVFSKALKYHVLHDKLLFVDRINYTLMSWYSRLIDMYERYKSTTPQNWYGMISSYFGELLDLLSTWLIYAIEETYSHGHLLECIYFLDLSSPKLMISDGFDENSKIDRNTNPCFYQVDLNAFQHVLFVITNHRPVDDLLKVNGYDYSSFENDVPSFIKSFHTTLSNFSPVLCTHRILLKPSFIRPLDSRIRYFYDVLNYFYERRRERTAFDNLGWSWLTIVQNDPGLVGQFYGRSVSIRNAAYKDNADVLKLFRNADQHMIQDLHLVSQGFKRGDILREFDQLLGFTEMIDEKVYAHAIKYQFKNTTDKENFIKLVGF